MRQLQDLLGQEASRLLSLLWSGVEVDPDRLPAQLLMAEGRAHLPFAVVAPRGELVSPCEAVARCSPVRVTGQDALAFVCADCFEHLGPLVQHASAKAALIRLALAIKPFRDRVAVQGALLDVEPGVFSPLMPGELGALVTALEAVRLEAGWLEPESHSEQEALWVPCVELAAADPVPAERQRILGGARVVEDLADRWKQAVSHLPTGGRQQLEAALLTAGEMVYRGFMLDVAILDVDTVPLAWLPRDPVGSQQGRGLGEWMAHEWLHARARAVAEVLESWSHLALRLLDMPRKPLVLCNVSPGRAGPESRLLVSWPYGPESWPLPLAGALWRAARRGNRDAVILDCPDPRAQAVLRWWRPDGGPGLDHVLDLVDAALS